MVEETIQAIRETETAADVIVKEAVEKSRKILEDARQEAEQMIKAQKEAHRVSAEREGGHAESAEKSRRISAGDSGTDREGGQSVKGACCTKRRRGSKRCDRSVGKQKLKKEGVHYGGTADAKSQYLRPEKRSKGSSGTASEDESDGNHADSGGGCRNFTRMDTRQERMEFEKSASLADQALEILDRYAPEKKSMFSALEGKTLIEQEDYQKVLEQKE